MKISDMVNAKDILSSLSQNHNLPTRVAYKLFLLITDIDKHLSFFETKRQELFLELGEREGENIIIPEKNKDAFLTTLNEIGEIECGDEVVKVDISLDIDLGIAPAEISLLTPFINFVE